MMKILVLVRLYNVGNRLFVRLFGGSENFGLCSDDEDPVESDEEWAEEEGKQNEEEEDYGEEDHVSEDEIDHDFLNVELFPEEYGSNSTFKYKKAIYFERKSIRNIL